MRIALVHDYLTQYGGAERVLETLHAHFPHARVVTAVLDPAALPESFRGMAITAPRLGTVPVARRHHRLFLPFYPAVFRRLGAAVRDADVVIADSSAWSHQIGVGNDQALVCYCHSPARFLYGDRDYLEPAGIPPVAKQALGGLFAALRAQDQRAAKRVDRYLANSANVAERIRRVYGRESRVVYPPIDLNRFAGDPGRAESWFLVVSRLVPHKRVDLAIDACLRIGAPLKIIGEGRARADLERRAGASVEFAGSVSDTDLASLLRRCRALILPAAEDFGMTAVEAQAAGRPVIAFRGGGALESVLDGETGLFFDHAEPESLVAALEAFGRRSWDPARARANARRFGTDVFLAAIDAEVALAFEGRRRRRP